MTDRRSSVEVATLLKAREWSIRILLLAAVSVLAAVLYNIWFTVRFMQVAPPLPRVLIGGPVRSAQEARASAQRTSCCLGDTVPTCCRW